MAEFISPLAARETTIARDLNLNLQKIMNGASLEPKEAALALLAVSRSVGYEELVVVARELLSQHGVGEAEIQEAEESAAIMAMLNTYYKFRGFITRAGETKLEDYRTAGLRMTSLAKPALGKVVFEMLAFAVSVVNGCETCVVSHEAVLRDAGVNAEKIHDLARLASVVRALQTLDKVK